MSGDTIFLLASAAAFVAALLYTRRGRAALATATAPATTTAAGFGGSFRELDSLADDEAYNMLGRRYVENRAKRRAAEIQGDLPSDPKGGS